jgi:transposase
MQRVVSGIVYVIRNGLQWKDAPTEYGPQDALQLAHVLEPAGRVRLDLRRLGG